MVAANPENVSYHDTAMITTSASHDHHDRHWLCQFISVR